MSIFSRITGRESRKHQQEISELKQDIEALSKFSQQSYIPSIDEKTLWLSKGLNDSASFDDDILISLWKTVPEVSTVISKITDRAKAVPWMHYKVKDVNKLSNFKKAHNDFLLGKINLQTLNKFKEAVFEPTFNEDIARLLQNPNDYQSWGEMIEQLVSYWYVLGNSYLIKLGSFAHIPDELNVMASQQTDIKIRDSYLKNPFQVNTDESAIEYYSFNNGYGKILTYDPELILHMKAPSLIYKDGGWAKGYSPLASAILASKTLKQEYISRLSLVRDRGSMGMIVGDGKANTTPGEEETKAVYDRVKKFGLGDGKTNSYAVTNAALKWMSMSFNSGELELLTGREENLKVLARKMNVPTDLLIGDSTYNNVMINGRIIYTSNVMPWLDGLQLKLNPLLGLDEKREVVMPVYDDIAELQQDLKVQTDIMMSQYNDGKGIATREEARVGVGRSAEPEIGEFKEENKNNNSDGTE
jgi:phage portal protein BeeE